MQDLWEIKRGNLLGNGMNKWTYLTDAVVTKNRMEIHKI